jgi:putative membrane protein
MKSLVTMSAIALALSLATAHAADKDGQSFIKTAIEHNYAEIDAGKLAQEKAKSRAVKDYGAMLVRDHGESNSKAIPVARQLDVKPPESADVMHKGTYLKLKVLSGDTFDRSFMDGMVSDHEADVKKFREQAGKGGPAGDFAKEILPKLEQHLAEAKKIQGDLKQTTGSK